ncbi:hypothetical protein BH11CYA1_BH11CYA1_08310 [soil metagenome]
MPLAKPSSPRAKAPSKGSTAIKSLLLASAVAAILSTTANSSLAETVASPASEVKESTAASNIPLATSDKSSEATVHSNSASTSASNSESKANASESLEKSGVPGEPPVLDPNKFFGHAKSGYAAAKLCPEICAKLFCYCGCDMTDDHDSLLDCFTTDHGVDCHICQEEALIALKMKREGKTIKQIQQAIDIMFEKEYPFDEPSAVIQKYRKNRLWQPGTVKTLGLQSGKPSGNGSAKAAAKAGVSTSKPGTRVPGKPMLGRDGKPAGACCAGHSKAK